jgi:hypothetical protein
MTMLGRIRRLFWKIATLFRSESWLLKKVRHEAQGLKDELEGTLTDKAVELLLYAMDVAFLLLANYRRNLRGFTGSYVLRTADNKVAASALFANQKMSVRREAIASPTVTVTFKTAQALRRFLSAKEPDILDSLLANDVEVEGNLNYVYKFCFMARDLTRRLGIS